jgi:hypothetical protein
MAESVMISEDELDDLFKEMDEDSSGASSASEKKHSLKRTLKRKLDEADAAADDEFEDEASCQPCQGSSSSSWREPSKSKKLFFISKINRKSIDLLEEDSAAIRAMAGNIKAHFRSNRNGDAVALRKIIQRQLDNSKNISAAIFQHTAENLIRLEPSAILLHAERLAKNPFDRDLLYGGKPQWQNHISPKFKKFYKRLVEEDFFTSREIAQAKLDLVNIDMDIDVQQILRHKVKRRSSSVANTQYAPRVISAYLREGDTATSIILMENICNQFSSFEFVQQFFKQSSFETKLDICFSEDDIFKIVDREEFFSAEELVDKWRTHDIKDVAKWQNNKFLGSSCFENDKFHASRIKLWIFPKWLNDERLQTSSFPYQSDEWKIEKRDMTQIMKAKVDALSADRKEEGMKLQRQWEEEKLHLDNKYRLKLLNPDQKIDFILQKFITLDKKFHFIEKKKNRVNSKSVVPIDMNPPILKSRHIPGKVSMSAYVDSAPWIINKFSNSEFVGLWIEPENPLAMEMVDINIKKTFKTSLVHGPETSSQDSTFFKPNAFFRESFFSFFSKQVNVHFYLTCPFDSAKEYVFRICYEIQMMRGDGSSDQKFYLQDESIFSAIERFKDSKGRHASFSQRDFMPRNKDLSSVFPWIARPIKEVWVQSNHAECYSESKSKEFDGELYFEPTQFFYELINSPINNQLQKQNCLIITHLSETYHLNIMFVLLSKEVMFQNEFIHNQKINFLNNFNPNAIRNRKPCDISFEVGKFMLQEHISKLSLPTSIVSMIVDRVMGILKQQSDSNQLLAEQLANILSYLRPDEASMQNVDLPYDGTTERNPHILRDLPFLTTEELISDFGKLGDDTKFKIAQRLSFQRLKLVDQYFSLMESSNQLRKPGRTKSMKIVKYDNFQDQCRNKNEPIVGPLVYYNEAGCLYALEIQEVVRRLKEDNRNPYTGQLFSAEFIEKMNNQYIRFDSADKYKILPTLVGGLKVDQKRETTLELQKFLTQKLDHLLRIETDDDDSALMCCICKSNASSPIRSAENNKILIFCNLKCAKDYPWKEEK